MICTIKWNALSIEEWEKRFSSLHRSNILQSYSYARAQCPLAKQKARWGLIFIDDVEAGLVQILEAGILFNAFHAVMLDRGPLWFDGFGNAMHSKLFYYEFNSQFPRRFGRRRRILPEVEDGATIQKILGQAGLNFENKTGYQTFWIDLKKDVEVLRSDLKQKWRNSLNKAERESLPITSDINAAVIAETLFLYAADKALRGYAGPSPDFLKAYMPILAARGDLYIQRIVTENKTLAFVLIARHGRAATYLAGWSSDDGRKICAHHLLLWNSLIMLKEKGVEDFDLGGINDDESGEGIKTFKEGLGGKEVSYAGLYS